MLRFYSLLFFLCIMFPSAVIGQPDVFIDLSRETKPEVSIAITGFTGLDPATNKYGIGKKGRQILENDLRLSELFQPVNRSLFGGLESDRIGKPEVDYNSWSQLGVQWMVNTQYAISKKNQLVTIIFRLYDIVNEQFLLGKRYRATAPNLRKIIHRFADEVVEALTGKKGIAGTRIAFLSGKRSDKEIYIVDFDGANAKKLTNENAVLLTPTWSPDGKSITYTSYVDKNPNLVMLDIDGKRRKILVNSPGMNTAPDWSPDGQKIAVVLSRDKNSEIYVMDKRSNLVRLTNHFNIDTSPSWSPDGKKIVFTSDRSGIGSPQIYIMDSQRGDRAGVQRISYGSNYNDNPTWSPDGDKIAYNSRKNGILQIKIYDLNTRKEINFTSGRGNKEEPSWSPDGRFLAYMMKKGGRPEIFIKKIGSNKARQLTFLPTGGASPSWSPFK